MTCQQRYKLMVYLWTLTGRSMKYQHRSVLDHLGPLWTIMDHLGLSWIISDCLGPSRTVLDQLGLSWTISDCLGPSQDCLGPSRTVLDHLGLSWTISDCLGPARTVLDYLGSSWTIWTVRDPRGMWTVCVSLSEPTADTDNVNISAHPCQTNGGHHSNEWSYMSVRCRISTKL